MKQLNLLTICVLSVSILTACSVAQEQFDFSKKAPDEFAVVTRAPLEMPSSYELPPPNLGAERPQESSAEEQAKQALFGSSASDAVDQPSTGESILLQRANAQDTPADIRAQVDAETQELADENLSTFNRILGKVGKKTDAPADTIDPVKERDRLILEQQQ